MQDLAELAALGVKVFVELEMSALRGFEDDRVARRRNALVARRGKHHEREVGHVDAIVVVPLVVVDHEHHGADWTPGVRKIEGTVVGELPIRKDLRLVTEEGYSLSFYLRDSFGSVVILGPMLDSTGNQVH